VRAVFFDAATFPFVFPFPPALALGFRLLDDGKSWQIGTEYSIRKKEILSGINAMTQQQQQELNFISLNGFKEAQSILSYFGHIQNYLQMVGNLKITV